VQHTAQLIITLDKEGIDAGVYWRGLRLQIGPKFAAFASLVRAATAEGKLTVDQRTLRHFDKVQRQLEEGTYRASR
jgi:hypothetical protein